MSEWYVQRNGAAVGPIALETLRAERSRGALADDDLVCQVGEQAWHRVRDLPVLAVAAPRRSLLSARLIALAGAGVLVLLAAGAGMYWLAARGPGEIAGLDPLRLPSTTRQVRVLSFVDPDEVGLDGTFAASALGHALCGGPDLAGMLLDAVGADLREVHSSGALGVVTDPGARFSVQCGEVLRTLAPSGRLVEVTFTEGEHELTVNHFTGDVVEVDLGNGFIRHSFSGYAGHCRVTADGGACMADGLAIFRADDGWFAGSLEAAEAFARQHASPRAELSTAVEILASMPGPGESGTTTLTARPERIVFAALCGRAAPRSHDTLAFIASCFPRGHERTVASLEAAARGVALHIDPMVGTGRIRMSIGVLARDEDAAETAERDLNDLARDWRSQIENAEPDLARMLRDPSPLHHDQLWGALRDAWIRAMRGMTVSRDGTLVSILVDEEIRDDERRQLEEYLVTRRTHEDAAVSVTVAVRDGAPLPGPSLAVIYGQEVADHLTLPRATTGDCQSFRERVGALGSGVTDPRLFGVRFRLERRFADPQCVGQAMPVALGPCVAGAQDLDQLDACRMADSPFVLAARRRLAGRWAVQSLSGFSYGVRGVLRTSRLQVSDERVAMQFGEFASTMALAVTSTDMDHATLRLPFGTDTPEFAVTFTGDDAFVATADVGTLAFARASFDQDLFSLQELAP